MWARLAIVAAALLSVSFPASASAQRCERDDVAAIDQYCELLSGAEGPSGIESPPVTLRQAIPAAARRKLQRAGPPGTALLALPPGVPSPDEAPDAAVPGAVGAVTGSLATGAQEGGAVARAVSAITGSGLSGLFRWAIVLSTVAVAGSAWVRRRT